ncbi:response regulator transcription factor [Chryseolinea sp. H1M3-3]|uniref:response regulator transcription factor n=1 Tax=Chryseolinea sp. H1M3-3 TaxID=3034144 RepID=UPI0023EC58B2|nr:response regulator transcription factor [Chryseolinea sp. H1M3-3]
MKVLVVEDNADLARNIQEYLLHEGYVCEWSPTFEKSQEKLISFHYDCIVLDIMLPDGNGLDLLNFIKAEKIKSNVLIISAKNSLDDKIHGLDLGADDYLTKPFHLSELNARLKAIYRRNALEGDHTVSYNEIVLNTTSMEASVNDVLLDLTKKEFDLLLYFLINKNRILTRQSLAEHLWGDYTDNLSNFDFVYQHVKNLRKKISAANGKDYIGTVYGIGYKFDTNIT